MIRVSSYPACCGIYILSDFGHATTVITKSYPKLTDSEREINSIISAGGVGMYIAALNEEQKPVYAELMEKLKFRPLVSDFMHTGHGNTITLYAHIVHGDNVKKDVVPARGKNSIFPVIKDYAY